MVVTLTTILESKQLGVAAQEVAASDGRAQQVSSVHLQPVPQEEARVYHTETAHTTTAQETVVPATTLKYRDHK